MPSNENDDFFLDFDGAVFNLESGHWIKFEVKRTKVTNLRPHGLRYSLTLHRGDNTRLLGFDNAHGVKPLQVGYRKRVEAFDHWHRSEFDDGKPYEFRGVLKLLEDFYAAVDRILTTENNQVSENNND